MHSATAALRPPMSHWGDDTRARQRTPYGLAPGASCLARRVRRFTLMPDIDVAIHRGEALARRAGAKVAPVLVHRPAALVGGRAVGGRAQPVAGVDNTRPDGGGDAPQALVDG